MHSAPTEVRFAIFLSGGFITAIVVNTPERKLAKRTSDNGNVPLKLVKILGSQCSRKTYMLFSRLNQTKKNSAQA